MTAGALVLLLLALPPVAAALESRLVGHAALQIPLLAAAGFLSGRRLSGRIGTLGGWNRDGFPGLLLAAGLAGVWMLPRSLDAALESPAVEVAKFVTLPALVGLPLALSWPRLPALARAFLWANAVPMLAALGWLYRVAPTRLCNSYLASEQRALGDVQLLAAGALAAGLAAWAFGGAPSLRKAGSAAESLGERDRSMGSAIDSELCSRPSRGSALARDL